MPARPFYIRGLFSLGCMYSYCIVYTHNYNWWYVYSSLPAPTQIMVRHGLWYTNTFLSPHLRYIFSLLHRAGYNEAVFDPNCSHLIFYIFITKSVNNLLRSLVLFYWLKTRLLLFFIVALLVSGLRFWYLGFSCEWLVFWEQKSY